MMRFHDGDVPARKKSVLPDPESMGDGIWSVPVPLPHQKLRYTRSGIISRPGTPLCLIDPGWETQATGEALEAGLALIGRRISEVEFVLLTHAHPDHMGLIPEIVRYTGAQVVMHPLEFAWTLETPSDDLVVAAQTLSWGVPDEYVDDVNAAGRSVWQARPTLDDPVLVEDGGMVPVPGLGLRTVWTPGHTAGHVCFVDEKRSLVFSGDHVLPGIVPGVGLNGTFSENPVQAYLDSLDKLTPFDSFRVAPGHGSILSTLKVRREYSKNHVEKRIDEVATILNGDPEASVFDVASRVSWSNGWQAIIDSGLLAVALRQIEAYRAPYAARSTAARPGS